MNTRSQIQLAKNLDSLRQSKRIGISELAKQSGVSQATLHGYLQGIQPKMLENLSRLASYFEVSMDQLLFDDFETVNSTSQVYLKIPIAASGQSFKLEIGLQEIPNSVAAVTPDQIISKFEREL